MDDFCRYCCSVIDNYAHEEELRYLSDDYADGGGIPIHLKTKKTLECSLKERSDVSVQLGLDMEATLRMFINLYGDELNVTIDEGLYGSDVFKPSCDEYITIAKLNINYCPMCGRKLNTVE